MITSPLPSILIPPSYSPSFLSPLRPPISEGSITRRIFIFNSTAIKGMASAPPPSVPSTITVHVTSGVNGRLCLL